MFLRRCSFQRWTSVRTSLGIATSRRLSTTIRKEPSPLQRSVLKRANRLINSHVPFVVPGYLTKRVSNNDVTQSERQETSEAVLDLLLRKQLFSEAFHVVHMMESGTLRISAPLRARVLTAQYINHLMMRGTYLNNIGELLGRAIFDEIAAKEHVHELLYMLMLSDDAAEDIKAVVNFYISNRPKGFRLDSISVAFLIKFYFSVDRRVDAEYWLEYYSKHAAPVNAEEDPEYCYPYTTFAQGALAAESDTDPRILYGPILDRMARDFAWPDTVFINVLISAELRHNHVSRALALYDTLRSHISHGVYPDETTYSQLFAAAARLAKEDAQTMRKEFYVSPRILFREMCELHAFIVRGLITERTPVLTKVSLGAALSQFVTLRDYAAAIIALKIYRRAHIPLEERAINSVVKNLVIRCQRDLHSRSASTSWAEVFLDLRGIPRRRVKNVSDWELSRRVTSVARRALAIAHLELLKSLKEALTRNEMREEDQKSDSSNAAKSSQSTPDVAVDVVMDRNEEGKADIAVEGKQVIDRRVKADGSLEEKANPDENVQTNASDETDPNESLEAPPTTFREEKKERMRTRRFWLIDVLLSRALETEYVVEGAYTPKELAANTVNQAGEEMIPNAENILRGRLDERPRDTNPPSGIN